MAEGDRRPYQYQHILPFGGLDHLGKGLFRPVEQDTVPEEVAALYACQRQGREGQHLHAERVGLLDARDDSVRVIVAVAHPDHGRGRGDFDKSVFHRMYLSFV